MTILITGSTGGIGKKITTHLLQKHTVIAFSRNETALQNLKKEVSSDNLIIHSVDVSDKQQVQRAFSKIDRLDALINCAGILGQVCPFLESDLDRWKQTMEINLLGSVYICYYALPLLLKSGRGKVINFSGGGSAYPRLQHSAYATSKAAVVRFTESLALEYPALDINAIAPGAHKTNMWKSELYDKEPENWGDMDRLLSFIDYLISARSNGITGKFIHYKDEWEKFGKQKLSKDIYTLRRIEQ
jgi:NAD(P)-dependent dehydrogenase (short-subunit alcohol dehydrogenase family)